MRKLLLLTLLLQNGLLIFAQQNDTALIAKFRTDWSRYLKNKEIENAVSQYSNEAILFSPDGKNAHGKAEITLLYRQVAKDFTSDLNFHSMGISISGDMASDSGTYEETMYNTATHGTTNLKGSYLMVLYKQKGQWKIIRIMWT